MAAKVHYVKSARKDYPAHGIAKGEPYYWWKFRYGGKHYSKTAPPPSRLTQSDFLREWLSIGEDLGREDGATFDETTADEYADRLDALYDSEESKFENLPESLQDVARRRYDLLMQSILTGRGIAPDGRSLGNDAHPPGVIFDDQKAELLQLCATLGIQPPETRLHDWEDWNRAILGGPSYRRPSGLSGLV